MLLHGFVANFSIRRAASAKFELNKNLYDHMILSKFKKALGDSVSSGSYLVKWLVKHLAVDC